MSFWRIVDEFLKDYWWVFHTLYCCIISSFLVRPPGPTTKKTGKRKYEFSVKVQCNSFWSKIIISNIPCSLLKKKCVVLCCVVLCCVVLCCVVLPCLVCVALCVLHCIACCIALRCVASLRVGSRGVALCHVVSYCAVLCLPKYRAV